ncbi:DUF6915 family protein [Psychrobacter sp. I-STPA10]|uniref:DUF6915 family protein n=1 Tax=Psychrobacter sp. I-STPA10 TaxID=2585769 RepID=UPI001E57079C|nr:hypothetical protein [Psychrobacter sp. I-STPA10]
MNSIKHAQISSRRRGGQPSDYIAIHQFIDSTKNLCSDNRHRIFHTLWAVNEIVLPMFGHTLINSDGVEVDIKDVCEKDHLLVDFRHRFIPTIGDFVQAIHTELTSQQQQQIEQFHRNFASGHPAISRLLLSPLAITGQLKSLLLTHNSWFMLEVIPQLPHLAQQVEVAELITDFNIAGDCIFKDMDFELWMDNGNDYPPSAMGLHKHKKEAVLS